MVNKYRRYVRETKTITINYLIKCHGHYCAGWVKGATARKEAFDRRYPGGVIDRTELVTTSNNFTCEGAASTLAKWHPMSAEHLRQPGRITPGLGVAHDPGGGRGRSAAPVQGVRP